MTADQNRTAGTVATGGLQRQLAEAFEMTVAAGAGGSGIAAADEADHIAALAAGLRKANITGTAGVLDDVPPPATVTERLPSLLANVTASPLADLLRPLAGQLDWYQIFEQGYAPDSLSNGMMAGQVIGGRGLLQSRDYYFGLFLVAPHVTYPLHQHAALEIYCVLTGEVSIRHGRDKPPMRITAGGHSVTPPYQVHELQTGESACLMAYGWTGDLVGENWWWEEQSDGSWERVCWRRMPDSSWQISDREALSEDEIRRAGDR